MALVRTWASPPTAPDLLKHTLGLPDPYLLWAELTDWRYFRTKPSRSSDHAFDHGIPLLVELKHGTSVAAFRKACEKLDPDSLVPKAYVDGRYATAWIKRHLLASGAAQQALGDLVERTEMSAPVRVPPKPKTEAYGDRSALKASVLLGVIDTGCPFAHASLRTSGVHTRLVAIWSQSHRGWLRGHGEDGHPPPAFEYGHQVNDTALNAWLDSQPRWASGLLDEADVYLRSVPPPRERRTHRPDEFRRLAGAYSHGAAVVDILAGPRRPRDRLPMQRDAARLEPDEVPSWQSAGDAASQPDKIDIAFVELPTLQLHDSTGGWLGVHVLNGVHYIASLARAQKVAHAVVNISYGGTTGPHDGSGILDCALVDACQRHDGKQSPTTLHLVMAAGNSFATRQHAELLDSETLKWLLPPGNEKPSFLQVWLPQATSPGQVKLEVTPPNGPTVALACGDVREFRVGDSAVAHAIYLAQSSLGAGAMMLLAIAPTDTARSDVAAAAPSGRWQVKVCANGQLGGTVHAWIARNDRDTGAVLRGQPSHFVDDCDEPSRYLRVCRDDPGMRADDIDDAAARKGSVIRRRSSLSGVAGARHDRIVVVAGYELQTGDHTPYSSAGQTTGKDGEPSQRRAAPTLAAVSDQSRSLPGLRVAGALGAATTRLVGTSVAAPMHARSLAHSLACKVTLPPTLQTPQPSAAIVEPQDLFGAQGNKPIAGSGDQGPTSAPEAGA